MAECPSPENRLFHLYATEYMEKVFYFCLKKTGNPQEAEELSSDISLNVLLSLNKGTRPSHFSAWVWKIAHNRYCAWAQQKHRRTILSSGDLAQLDIPDPAADTEASHLHREQAALMRRELAFISSDYRSVLAAYYLEKKRIKDIADQLSLPPGTVMTKLHRARKQLKEGMEMAREFGRRSYQPEAFGFSSSGYQPSGLPFSAVQRKIPVNILLHASNNPCTLEELALELGVAMPYMEEEVSILLKSELLKKLDNGRYIPGFFISPKQCQDEIARLKCNIADRYVQEFWHLGKMALNLSPECGIDTSAYSNSDAQMFFALYFSQQLENACLPPEVFIKFRRADGGNWGFMGHEHGARYPVIPIPLSNNCSNWRGLRWEGFQSFPSDENPLTVSRHSTDVPDGYLHSTLQSVAEGSDIHPTANGNDDLSVLLSRRFVIERNDGSYAVNAIRFPENSRESLDEKIKSSLEYATLKEAVGKYIHQARKILASYFNPWLKEDLDYYTGMSVILRSILIRRWIDLKLYKGNNLQFCAFFH
ncbi:MAG: RNA polymerase sigma factor [Clostridiales bacterium]|nr:RNA polymerase sigma factor [Clostridiales bacterium]